MNFNFKRMLKFEINIGTKEKKIRIYVGGALIFISLFLASIPLILIGLVLLATGFSTWCPIYSGMEKSTVEEE
jgi:hypothetical protein